MIAAPLVFDDYFSGAGMVPAALIPAGWSCRFANDIDAGKGIVYRTNWGPAGLKIADIDTLTPRDIPPGRADLSWASFPCVDVSEAGQGAGLAGKRSGTFWSYINLTKALKGEGRGPKIVAIENVVGLISGRGGRDFLAATTALMDLGYVVGACVLDASDWLPQERKRIFIIGVDRNIPIPAGLTSQEPIGHFTPLNLRRVVAGLPPELKAKWRWWALPIPPKRTADLIDILVDTSAWDTPEQTAALVNMLSPASQAAVAKARESGELTVGAGFRRTREAGVQFEVRFDGLAGCLRTASGGSSRQVLIEIEGAKTRSRLLTARECARAMGLGDTFKLPPARNDALTAMGDGVAVPCVAFLNEHLFLPLLGHPTNGVPAMANTLHVDTTSPKVPKPRAKKKGNGLEPFPAEVFTPSAARMIEELARLETKSPDHSEPAPAPTPSQGAAPLNALLMSAMAPGDVNFDEATASAGPIRYTSLQRRRPKGDEVFHLLPQTYGSTMVYMFSLSREAKGRGEHDSYIVTPLVRAGVVSQPHILKRIRRCALCITVNTFGAHFMVEIDMDSTNFAAQASRDWARLAREQWINMYWDEGKKQHVYQSALDQSMPVALPAQSFNELVNLTYDESTFISSLDHPILRRLWIAV